MTASASATPARDTDVEVIPIDAGWELASSAPSEDAEVTPPGDGWLPARVPGTVAGALGREAFSTAGPMRDLDAEDWWFRTRFQADPAEAGESVHLRLDGIATVAEVFLNGRLILTGESMFEAHRIEVGEDLSGDNELLIRCRALGPLLKQRRKPRARWRTRVTAGNLRFFRTMILGRAPGFAPGPAAVGPWRPISLERSRGPEVGAPRLRTRLEGDDGVLSVSVPVDAALTDVTVRLDGPSGVHEVALTVGDGIAAGDLTVPGVAPWWPHTHGEPNLHEVQLLTGERVIDAGRVGLPLDRTRRRPRSRRGRGRHRPARQRPARLRPRRRLDPGRRARPRPVGRGAARRARAGARRRDEHAPDRRARAPTNHPPSTISATSSA